MHTWNGPAFVNKVKQQVARNLEAAAIHLRNRIRENISIPSRTVSLSYSGGKVKRTLGPRGGDRSKPGEFPHKDTGMLRQSIAYDVDRQNLKARIGTPLQYGLYLELGTRKMAARPFLRRTFNEEKEPIRQIVVRGDYNSIRVG